MKNFNYYLGFLAVFALLFTSCSKEESGIDISDQDTIQIQFGALLNDFSAKHQSKIHDLEPGECIDADPAYVRLAIADSEGVFVGDAGGTTTPSAIKVNLKNNGGSWETMFSDELGLPAGDYTLEYFVVYSAANEVLWVAPRVGGDYAGSVTTALPLDINLQAGTKPYINVDVLCFIPRNEEAFGYLFFDINFVEVENNYCIFVNFCDDESGREYPALFRVDVWSDSYGGSDIVINGETNSVSGSGNSFAATVLCFPLPPLEEGEVYYVRVSVLSVAGVYNADASDTFQFLINQSDIDAQLDETPRYEHLRIKCNPNQGEPFCTPTTTNVSSCNFFCEGGIYGFLSEEGDNGVDGFINITSDNFDDTFKLYRAGTTNAIATVDLEFGTGTNAGDLRVMFSNVDGTITAFEIDARLPNGVDAQVCNDTRCNDQCEHNDDFTERLEGDVITPDVLSSTGFYLKVRAQKGECPE